MSHEPDVSFGRIDPDTGERFQSLRRELGIGSFGMNVIVLHPRERGRIHDHEVQEEVYLVLEGELTLGIDGDERRLGVGEVARVGPGTRRQLQNHGTERLVIIALGAAGEHKGRDARAWTSWEDDDPGRPPQEIPLPDNLPAD
jgi:mannose-6-phosphate isomerase-like protein (cupin superfamily)